MDDFSRHALRVSVAQICENVGWTSIMSTPFAVLTDLLEEYICGIAKTAGSYSLLFGECEPNLNHVTLALRQMGVSESELATYMDCFEAKPALKVPKYPLPKESKVEPMMPPEHIQSQLSLMNLSQNDEDDGLHKSPLREEIYPNVLSPLGSSPNKYENLYDMESPKCTSTVEEDSLFSSYLPVNRITSVTMSEDGVLLSSREGKLPQARIIEPVEVTEKQFSTSKNTHKKIKRSKSGEDRKKEKKKKKFHLDKKEERMDKCNKNAKQPKKKEDDNHHTKQTKNTDISKFKEKKENDNHQTTQLKSNDVIKSEEKKVKSKIHVKRQNSFQYPDESILFEPDVIKCAPKINSIKEEEEIVSKKPEIVKEDLKSSVINHAPDHIFSNDLFCKNESNFNDSHLDTPIDVVSFSPPPVSNGFQDPFKADSVSDITSVSKHKKKKKGKDKDRKERRSAKNDKRSNRKHKEKKSYVDLGNSLFSQPNEDLFPKDIKTYSPQYESNSQKQDSQQTSFSQYNGFLPEEDRALKFSPLFSAPMIKERKSSPPNVPVPIVGEPSKCHSSYSTPLPTENKPYKLSSKDNSPLLEVDTPSTYFTSYDASLKKIDTSSTSLFSSSVPSVTENAPSNKMPSNNVYAPSICLSPYSALSQRQFSTQGNGSINKVDRSLTPSPFSDHSPKENEESVFSPSYNSSSPKENEESTFHAQSKFLLHKEDEPFKPPVFSPSPEPPSEINVEPMYNQYAPKNPLTPTEFNIFEAYNVSTKKEDSFPVRLDTEELMVDPEAVAFPVTCTSPSAEVKNHDVAVKVKKKKSKKDKHRRSEKKHEKKSKHAKDVEENHIKIKVENNAEEIAPEYSTLRESPPLSLDEPPPPEPKHEKIVLKLKIKKDPEDAIDGGYQRETKMFEEPSSSYYVTSDTPTHQNTTASHPKHGSKNHQKKTSLKKKISPITGFVPVMAPDYNPAPPPTDAVPNKYWICPVCKLPDDGSPMIACDSCDYWFHWVCVGILADIKSNWYCAKCRAKREERLKKKKNKSKKQTYGFLKP